MDLLVYDDEDRRYVPALVVLMGALLLGLVLGGSAFLLARPASVTPVTPVTPLSGATEPEAAQAETTCAPALEKADAALEVGARLGASLAQQTTLMDELLAGRATARQVLTKALPPLTVSAKDRQDFLDAVTAYQKARADCQQ